MHNLSVIKGCARRHGLYLLNWQLLQQPFGGICLSWSCTQNGYVRDERGLHHVVLNAVVETLPDQDCYGVLDLFEHELSITGVGRLASHHLQLDHKA